MRDRRDRRAWLSFLTVAALTLLGVATAASPAAADYRVDCNPAGDSRRVVILVHGFNSAQSVWTTGAVDILTGSGTDTCVVRFDYSAHHTNWVTDPHIGPALAAAIATWSAASTAGGGSGRVVVVAHSMGGLAARCALDPGCSGVDVASRVAEVITFGTPNTGSWWRASDATPALNLAANLLSAACKTGLIGAAGKGLDAVTGYCDLVKLFGTSDAAKAFTPDSPELGALPHFPAGVSVYALAGQVTLRTSLFGHVVNTIGSAGDLVVGVASALDEANQDGDPSETIDCGVMNLPDLSSFADLACIHTTEPNNEGFLNAARHQILDIPATAPEPQFTDVNGRWCNQDDPTDCFTVNLPALTADGYDPIYIYPTGQEDVPPDQFDYDTVRLNPFGGECWDATQNSYPPEAGDSFFYCPAETTMSWDDQPLGVTSYDRIVMGQDIVPEVYVRAH